MTAITSFRSLQMASNNCVLEDCQEEGSNFHCGEGLVENAQDHDEQAAPKEVAGLGEAGAALDASASSSRSKTPPSQHIEEDEVDLSCEYCGNALFVSFEDKLQHLETMEHWEKVIQVCGLPRADDDCEPSRPMRLRIRRSLTDDSDGSFSDSSEGGLTKGYRH